MCHPVQASGKMSKRNAFPFPGPDGGVGPVSVAPGRLLRLGERGAGAPQLVRGAGGRGEQDLRLHRPGKRPTVPSPISMRLSQY